MCFGIHPAGALKRSKSTFGTDPGKIWTGTRGPELKRADMERSARFSAQNARRNWRSSCAMWRQRISACCVTRTSGCLTRRR